MHSKRATFRPHRTTTLPRSKINMQLTISETFTADLNDQSSEKYNRYKRIFEEEFYERYRTLPGFVSANLTSFREGSVHVNYFIIADEPTKSSLEVANANIVRNLNTTFPFPSSAPPLVPVISGKTNLTLSPGILYQGETLTLTCRTRSNSTSVSWTHNGVPVNISAANTIKDGVSESILVISNIASSHSDLYSCYLNDTRVIYVASRNVTVLSINTTFNSSNDILCDGNRYVLYKWCTNGQIADFICDCSHSGGPFIDGAWEEELRKYIRFRSDFCKVILWLRYIDDLFQIWRGTTTETTDFVHRLNNNNCNLGMFKQNTVTELTQQSAKITPGNTNLNTKITALERLYEREQRKWWEATSLQSYIDVDRVPRGLRIHTIPAYENPDPKLLDEWAAHTAKSSKEMLFMLVKFAWSDRDKALLEIDKMEAELDKEEDTIRVGELKEQMKKRLVKYEAKIKLRKQEKFERDERDYALVLSTIEQQVLRLGLTFCPTSRFEYTQTRIDLFKLTRKFTLHKYFKTKPNFLKQSKQSDKTTVTNALTGVHFPALEVMESLRADTTASQDARTEASDLVSRSKQLGFEQVKDDSQFKPTFQFVPQLPMDAIDVFAEAVNKDLLKLRGQLNRSKIKRNISKEQWEAIEDLANNENCICKPSDKGDLLSKMEKDKSAGAKGLRVVQSNKLDRYAHPKEALQGRQSRGSTSNEQGGDDQELTWKDVMNAITCVKTSLEHKMDTITIEVNLLQADLIELNEKVKQVELTTSSLVGDVRQLQGEIHDLQSFGKTTELKLDDYEGRLRCSNLRIQVYQKRLRDRLQTSLWKTLFYNIYSPKALVYMTVSSYTEEDSQDLLWDIRFPHLSPEDRDFMDSDLNTDEIAQAIQALKTGDILPDQNCLQYLLDTNVAYCPIETSGETSSYRCHCNRTCELISDTLTVTLIRKATVEIRGVTNVSQHDNLTLVCSSDVPISESMTWQVVRRDGGSPDLQAYLQKKNTILSMPNVLQYWEGNYTCTVFQRITNSSISSVITILPLPSASQLRTNIVDGIYACPSIVNLTCCATDSNKYNFQFKVQGSSKPINEFSAETQCFETTYNYTSCDMDRTVIDCIVNNTLKSTTKSMIVRPLKGKATCNGFGIGQEGDTITIPCTVDYAGTITYTCTSSVWANPTSSCIPQKLSQLVAESEELRFLPPSEIPNYLENLVSNVTAAEESITTFETMNALVGVLKTVSEVTTSVDVTMMQNFLNTTDVLVKKQDIWASVTEIQRNEGGSQLLQSMETFSQGLQINDTITQMSDTIILHGIVANNDTNDYYEKFAFGNTTGKVNISSETLATIRNFSLVTIAYSSLNDILTVNQSETVNGLVMSMVVSKQKGANVRDNFYISMMFEKINSSLPNALCVFWKFNDYGSGKWDTTGCTTTEQEEQVLCTCDHFTPFTILMSSSPSGGNTTEEEKQRQVTLEYITYIGVAISMGSLAICLIIETLSWKSFTKNTTSYMRHVCLVNIAVSLLIADIWFIVGASLTPQLSNHTISNATAKHTQACDAATFFTHIFYLAVFFWMLAMGLILFYRLVYVLHYMTTTCMLALTFSLGYGCPLIISVVTVAVTSPQNYYREGNSCWLNMLNTRAFLAFVIPALTIVAVNLIILALVIITLLRPSVGAQPRKEEKNTLLKIAKSVAILTPLLGLTWGFGIGILITNNFTLNVIFSLLNSLQCCRHRQIFGGYFVQHKLQPHAAAPSIKCLPVES
ncbi:uncharacterized protein LOC144762241 [Lissotriton helveticus]